MTDIKWIKVTVDMFEDSKIEFLRSLPEGDSIIVIWLQLLSLAGKSNADGYLMITDGIPYTEQVLSNTLRRNPVLLQYALESFLKLKMINVEDGPFHITKWEKHQSAMRMEEIKSKSALKQAAYRQRQKEKQLLLPKGNENVTKTVTRYVTKSNSYQTDIEIDLDLKEKDKNSSSFKDLPPQSFSLYQNEIGIVSNTISQKLQDDVETYGDEWVCDAIREAVLNNVRKYSYIEKVLKTWGTSGRGSSKVAKTGQAAYRQEPKYGVHEMTADELANLPRG